MTNESFLYHACLKALHYYFIARSEAFYQGMTKSPVSRPLVILNFFNMHVTFVRKLWTLSCQNWGAMQFFFFFFPIIILSFFFWKYVLESKNKVGSVPEMWSAFSGTLPVYLSHIHIILSVIIYFSLTFVIMTKLRGHRPSVSRTCVTYKHERL